MTRLFFLIVLPIGFLISQIIIEHYTNNHVMGKLLSENGPYEIIQFLIISSACIVALFNVFLFKNKSKRLLVAWCITAFICCLYVAGEEVSWGQHFFEWQTPAEWSEHNDQNETNLHNTSSWLDQKPRLLLLLGIVLGGVVLPIIRKFKELPLPEYILELIPPKDLMVIALCVIVPYIADKIGEAYDLILFIRVSEIQELYMFYFVLTYLIFLKRIIRH